MFVAVLSPVFKLMIAKYFVIDCTNIYEDINNPSCGMNVVTSPLGMHFREILNWILMYGDSRVCKY